MSLEFNIKNSNTVFPLFFGEDLGLSDGFNVTYPELKELNKNQRELFWASDEIDFYKDSQDFLEVDENIQEYFKRALSFQYAGDSIANGSIQMLFMPILSNPQAKGLISYHGDSESVHDETYAKIVAQMFNDPNEFLDRVRSDVKLFNRIQPVLQNFATHMDMIRRIMNKDDTLTLSEKRKTTIKTIITLLALEGIMFLSSFATTFAICETTQKFNGIKKAIGLIHDDESISHVNNNLAMLNIIINKERWFEWNEVKDEAKGILDTIIEMESDWADSLFSGCDAIVGFNHTLLKQYTKYLAKPLYDRLGLDWDFEVITEHPLPWIKKYVKSDVIQTAAQEAQVTNYKVNSTLDDVDSVDFDFYF